MEHVILYLQQQVCKHLRNVLLSVTYQFFFYNSQHENIMNGNMVIGPFFLFLSFGGSISISVECVSAPGAVHKLIQPHQALKTFFFLFVTY